MRPILLAVRSVNQIAPSLPSVISFGPALAVGSANSVIVPDGVSGAIAFVAPFCVIHKFPSRVHFFITAAVGANA